MSIFNFFKKSIEKDTIKKIEKLLGLKKGSSIEFKNTRDVLVEIVLDKERKKSDKLRLVNLLKNYNKELSLEDVEVFLKKMDQK